MLMTKEATKPSQVPRPSELGNLTTQNQTNPHVKQGSSAIIF